MRKAFTLVELLVVITVLGVLSTIGFISYVGYAEDSRDGVRVANLNDIKKGLELKKSQTGDFPTPDNAYSVQYLGKEIWKQGTLGNKTKKQIKFNAIEMDPKYDTDYSYSVSSNGKRFELGTVLEDETNSPLSYFVGNTYASGDEKALNFGNLRGKFHVAKVNGETHVFSIPSMIFRDSSNLNVVVDQPTTQFSVTGEGALPEAYIGKSEINEAVTFTPRLLYRGPNCGVETDQEIVNFIATLRDSFNYDPYTSNPDYKDVFEDYNTLRNNMDDFDTLKKLGLKINKLLDCDIKSFKTVDIFPTQCGYEGLNFEGVTSGYDIETQSCLFNYSGDGSATVQSGIGGSNTQGLYIDPVNGTGEFSYRVFTYTPMKFHFDYLPNLSSSSNFKFFINDVEYKYMNRNSSDYDNLTFKEFESPLLKPGLYDFKWVIYKYGSYGHGGEVTLDDLDFTCLGGGNGCGWTDYEFEVGPLNPWDVLEFSGGVQSTWEQVDRGNGTLAIKSPPLGVNAASFITKTVTLDQPSKIEFDMMTDLSGNGSVKFFIDDIEFLSLTGDGGKFEDNYDVYSTPLLPEGTYQLKWRVDRYTWYKSIMWLDQLRFTCIGGADIPGNEGCGWESNTYENGNINPWSEFDFTGALESYHWKQVERSPGNMAITNMLIHGNGKTSIEKEITLAIPAKVNFDMMTDINGNGSVRFYINDNRMINLYQDGGVYEDKYELYTSELLPAGTYKLRWDLDRYTWYRSYMWLDNFHLSCEGGASIGGNETCGWAQDTLEPGNINPWNNLIPSGNLESYEWIQTDKGDGTYVIKNNEMDNHASSTLEKTITLSSPAKFNFNMKMELNYGTKFNFYINGDSYINYTGAHDPFDDQYLDYETQMLPVGTYTFRWEIQNYYGNDIYIWLDSMSIDCVNGGIGCGWDIVNYDYGSAYPWTDYTFSGALKSYQWYQKNDGSGNNILTHTSLSGLSSITKNITLSDYAKINFDIKTNFIANSQMRFYINDNLIYTHSGDNSEFEDNFTNYETTLLDPGAYDFKIEIDGDYRTIISLDNFGLSCLGGGSNCGWNSSTLGIGNEIPSTVFNYSGDLTSYQWMQKDNGDGTYSLTNAELPSNGSTAVEKSIVLGSNEKISFDLKTDLYVHSDVKFYVDGQLQLDIDGYTDTLYDGNFRNYETSNTFSAGNHVLRWELDRYYNAVNHIWIKNLDAY